MPGKRRKGQVFLGLQVEEKLVEELDRVRKFKDRSQFIREAIAEKITRMTHKPIPEEWTHPPSSVRVLRGSSLPDARLNETSPAYGEKSPRPKRKKT